MPKIKVRKSVRKRFKVTAKGKVKSHRAGRRHLLSVKSGKTKRRMRTDRMLSPGETARVMEMIGRG